MVICRHTVPSVTSDPAPGLASRLTLAAGLLQREAWRDRRWVLRGDRGFVAQLPLAPLQETNHTLRQASFLECQEPSQGLHWSRGEQGAGERGTGKTRSGPTATACWPRALSDSFRCFEPGLLKGPGAGLPCLPQRAV